MTEFTHVWQKPPENLPINAQEIHVWCASTDQLIAELPVLEKSLNAAEKARAQKYVFDKDRLRYTLGKGFLRRLLGQYLNLLPERVEFSRSSYGKPEIIQEQNSLEIHFNSSDSGEMIVAAISRNINLGVDVEFMRANLDVLDIAKTAFTPREYQALLATSATEQRAMFYRLWTRKEAFVKNIGMGLYYPLDKADVLNDATTDNDTGNTYKLYSLSPANDYQAALSIDNIDVQNIALWRI